MRSRTIADRAELPAAATHGSLLASVAADLAPIVAAVARDVAEPADAVEPAVAFIVAALLEANELGEARLAALREEGARAARAGIPLPVLLDRYLSAGWVLWGAATSAAGAAGSADTRPAPAADAAVDGPVLAALGTALLKAGDAAAAALSEGHARAGRELATRAAAARRDVLEELLALQPGDAEATARLARRAAAAGLDPAAPIQPVLVALSPELADIETGLETIRRALSSPPRARDREQARRLATSPEVSTTAPFVALRDGRLVILVSPGSADSRALEAGLRQLAPREGWLAVRGQPAARLAEAGSAYRETADALLVALRLGLRGLTLDADALLLERTLVADESLTRRAVERELGPLRRSPRGGETLVTTLETFLVERQNLRATARRLGIGPRTVSYRLARIERLTGRRVDGEASLRLAAALFADRLLTGRSLTGAPPTAARPARRTLRRLDGAEGRGGPGRPT